MEKIIFGIIGGLGLFIFGMKYLSDSLQKIASVRVRRWLRTLTNNPIKGLSLGALVTSIIQSSSVTTVILIGLINAGIINLFQAASVIIGANIGTTITAQIIAFKISKYALPAIGIGAIMILTMKKKKLRFWGQLILAFGLIFLGLNTMSSVAQPLKNIPAITNFFVALSQHPLLGICVGMIFTISIQSSSASIGMLVALASAGLIDFRAALYVLLGDNIGTTVTAWLASIGGSISARRMAAFHSIFNIVGAMYFTILISLGIYERIIDFITPGPITPDTISRNIANAHTVFNVVNAIVFIPLIGIFVTFIKKIIPGEASYVQADLLFLQDNLLDTPAIAIDSTKKEMAEMAKMAQKAIKTAIDGFFNRDKQSIQYVETQEDAIDSIQHDITFYLSKLSPDTLTEDLAAEIPALIHTVNDIERISDHSMNIADLTDTIIGEDLKFTDEALNELQETYKNINEMFENAITAITTNDSMCINSVIDLEQKINESHKNFLNQQSKRFLDKKCTSQETLVLINMINNLEKIGDHLTNIAQAASKEFCYS